MEVSEFFLRLLVILLFAKLFAEVFSRLSIPSVLGEVVAGIIAPALDHAAIGNGRVLALISPTSAIEWLCLPRFDAPSVYGRLLDRERGGTFRILAADEEIRGDLTQVRKTNVTRIRFERGEHAWEVLDYAPRIPEGLDVRVPIEIVRVLRPIKGRPRVRIDFDPRPDYGRVTAEIVVTALALEVHGAPAPTHVSSDIPHRCILGGEELVLEAPAYFAMTWPRPYGPRTFAEAERDLDLTVAGWRAWEKSCALPTFAARPRAALRVVSEADSGGLDTAPAVGAGVCPAKIMRGYSTPDITCDSSATSTTCPLTSN